MKPRDFRDFNEALAADIRADIIQHPDSIDVLVFRPDMAAMETMAEDEDVVGSIEAEERAVPYLDPVIVRGQILNEQFPFDLSDQGDEPDGNMDQPVVILMADAEIPKQTALQYEEFINATDIRKVSLAILRSELIGKAPGAASKHYCIPVQLFEFEFIEPPRNELPAHQALAIAMTPTLSASPFIVHGITDTHEESQWQFRGAGGNYAAPTYDSGQTADLRSHAVPGGALAAQGCYFWRVRYRGAGDDAPVWSDWSVETSFTTAGEGE
jgi:hypothetical protein